MPPQPRDLIVVGASAGGVEALRTLVATLPPDLPAAVAVVLHLPTGGRSALANILTRAGRLDVVAPTGPTPLRSGTVYVARPNHHLLVMDGEVALSHGPTENGHRPAIDPLFRSAALAAGPRVIGVILSGVLDDGVAGLVSIVRQGGVAVVQDPADALFPGMPEQALQHVRARCVLPVADMGAALAELAKETVDVEDAPEPTRLMALENEIAGNAAGSAGEHDVAGGAAGYACPDCNGSLMELERNGDRFRCRVGHGWTAEALLDAQGESLERALWTALRTLDEKVALASRMCVQSRNRGAEIVAARYEQIRQEATEAAEVLRKHLTSVPVVNATDPAS